MDTKSDDLSEEGPGEPRTNQLPVRTSQGRLVEALANYPSGKLVVLELQVWGPLGVGVHQRLMAVGEAHKEAVARVKQCRADQLKPLPAHTTPVQSF